MGDFNTGFNIPVPDFGTAMAAGKGYNASQFLGGGGGATPGGMDPFTLVMGGIGGIGSNVGGFNSANAMNNAAFNTAQATKYGADRAAQAGIDVAKGNLAQTMFGARFGSAERDREFARQQDAFRFRMGEGGDIRRDSQRRDMLANLGFQSRGDAKKLRQEQNRSRMKQSVAERLAAGRGMFGQIAPVSVSSMVV